MASSIHIMPYSGPTDPVAPVAPFSPWAAELLDCFVRPVFPGAPLEPGIILFESCSKLYDLSQINIFTIENE